MWLIHLLCSGNYYSIVNQGCAKKFFFNFLDYKMNNNEKIFSDKSSVSFFHLNVDSGATRLISGAVGLSFPFINALLAGGNARVLPTEDATGLD